MSTVEITTETFKETIENNDIVLLDWWASWCGPCRAFGPIYERVAAKNPDVVFGKVNTEEQQALAAQFGIRSIPTLMIIRGGTLLFSQPGMLPQAVLEDLLAQARNVDMDEVRREVAKSKSGEMASAATA